MGRRCTMSRRGGVRVAHSVCGEERNCWHKGDKPVALPNGVVFFQRLCSRV